MADNWEYIHGNSRWKFLLSIPDHVTDAHIKVFEGIFQIALEQCRERVCRLVNITDQNGESFHVDLNESTQALLKRLGATKNIHERMAIQAALAIHCA
jgi:hypothetical protein